jgi:hypothetical protein
MQGAQSKNLSLMPWEDKNVVRRKALRTLMIWEERVNIKEFTELFGITEKTFRNDLDSLKSENSRIVAKKEFYQFSFYSWQDLFQYCIECELNDSKLLKISLKDASRTFRTSEDEMLQEFNNYKSPYKFSYIGNDLYNCSYQDPCKHKLDKKTTRQKNELNLKFIDKKTNYTELKITAILKEFVQFNNEIEITESELINHYLESVTHNDDYLVVLDWLIRKNLRTPSDTAVHSALASVSKHLTTPSLDDLPIFFIWQIFKAIRNNTVLYAVFFSKRMSHASQNSDGETPRLILPHSLFYTESNWYLRGFEDKFKDFRLTRFALHDELLYKEKDPDLEGISEDHLWNSDFTLQLIPNCELDYKEKVFTWRDINTAHIIYKYVDGKLTPILQVDWESHPKEYIVRSSFVPYVLKFLKIERNDPKCRIQLTNKCYELAHNSKLFF